MTSNDSHANSGSNKSDDVISPLNLESPHTFSMVSNNSSNTCIGENVRGSRTIDSNLVSSLLNFIIIMIRTTIARTTRQKIKYVVHLGDNIAPIDIEVDRNKCKIQIPLPLRIDASVTMMTVEKIEQLPKVIEMTLLHPERLVKLGLDPPKCVLLYGPGTDATFIHVIGSKLFQKYVSELFQMARTKHGAVLLYFLMKLIQLVSQEVIMMHLVIMKYK